MGEKQILDKKQRGDNAIVAQMLTKELGRYISPGNVRKLLERPTAKDHEAATKALKRVIESREALLEPQV